MFTSTICSAQIALSHFNDYKHYTVEDGLASTYISGITEDKYGFLWIATGNGVSRYDGNHFTNFTTYLEDSIQYEIGFVTSMIVDESGENLWIASKHGIIHTSIDTVDFIKIDKLIPTNKSHVRKVNDLLLDNQKKLWIASFNEGLYSFNLNGDQHNKNFFISGSPQLSAFDTLVIPRGDISIVTLSVLRSTTSVL